MWPEVLDVDGGKVDILHVVYGHEELFAFAGEPSGAKFYKC